MPEQDVAAFRAEMVAAGARWHLTEFGNSRHGFTDRDAAEVEAPGVEYDPLADEGGVLTLAVVSGASARHRSQGSSR